ncbi:uncharacterized protein LOC106092548 [Stomoxys calcitrans]|uniref:uncharacterized protein LOC106092548 n=1 Tax=Stomoxys calcitrans TaxID=35570 RepID=UPI0027E25F7C|nr:uncharacterized protein LOC106092548 [Stomoxys calcitrans]
MQGHYHHSQQKGNQPASQQAAAGNVPPQCDDTGTLWLNDKLNNVHFNEIYVKMPMFEMTVADLGVAKACCLPVCPWCMDESPPDEVAKFRVSFSIKSTNANGRPQPWWCRNNRGSGGSGTNGRGSLSAKHSADSIRRPTSNSGVWTWLGGSRRSSEGPDQIGPPSSSPAENHYTHMDDAYSPVGVSEALYAELDRESVRSNNPSYQNTGYSQCGDKYTFHQQDHDIPIVVSSAPSSAYYSDLSVTGVPGGTNERAYEIVGLTVMNQPLPNWEGSGGGVGSAINSTGVTASGQFISGGPNAEGMASQRRIPRLAAINETSTTNTATVPSDYV